MNFSSPPNGTVLIASAKYSNACKMPLPHAADSPECGQDQSTTQDTESKHMVKYFKLSKYIYSTKVLAMAMTAIKERVSASEKKHVLPKVFLQNASEKHCTFIKTTKGNYLGCTGSKVKVLGSLEIFT